jgi:hypothetical protein
VITCPDIKARLPVGLFLACISTSIKDVEVSVQPLESTMCNNGIENALKKIEKDC